MNTMKIIETIYAAQKLPCRFRQRRKGSVAVEAAIVLPFFLIGILVLGSLIKYIYLQENIMHSISDEARKAASRAYLVKGDPFLPGRIKERIQKENPEISRVEVNRFRYLAGGLSDGEIALEVDYFMKLRFPLDLYEGMPGREALLCRGFIGSRREEPPSGFEEMRKEQEPDPVWIFPDAGIRYHKKECTYVTAAPSARPLTSSVRKEYEACGLCRPGKLPEGSRVFCFFRSGEAYHRGSCKTVDRYVVETERENARSKGYTPCVKCGG